MWGTRKKAGAPGLQGMSNDEMKTLLRAGGHPYSGDRATLAQRIIDLNLPLPQPSSPPPRVEEVYPLPAPCPDGTEVVNLKVEFLRPTYNDAKAWCEDPSGNNVYIGRGGIVFVDGARYPPTSKWHNPYTSKEHGTRAVELYDQYIRAQPFLDQIEELRGKKLGCWCVDPNNPAVRCHGHVLITILNERAGVQEPRGQVLNSSSTDRLPPVTVPGIPTLRGQPLQLPPVPRIDPLPSIAGIMMGPSQV
jgi:hypothetical protein